MRVGAQWSKTLTAGYTPVFLYYYISLVYFQVAVELGGNSEVV